MAVYTKINKKDISIINNKFDIEKIINFQGIKKGIENTDYVLKSKNIKFKPHFYLNLFPFSIQIMGAQKLWSC